MLRSQALQARWHPIRPFQRFKSTLKVAIVGSGPSGFYTATELLKQHQKRPNETHLHVTLFDKLPTPFGLSRYGVSPDHMEVKNCEETFTDSVLSNSDKFDFVGNVKIGQDVSIGELKKNFHSVVFAYGNTKEVKLGIRGEDLPGVITAKDFVGWYNGNPEFDGPEPPLEKAERVVIIGNGNVAMDIARLLLIPPRHLKETDITEHAFKKFEQNRVKDVKIVARRGLLESAFATKEVRELLQLEEFGVKFNDINSEVVKYVQPLLKKADRIIKRKIETVLKFMKPIEERKVKYAVPDTFEKSFSLEYLKSPVEIIGSETDRSLLKSIKFQHNKIVQDSLEGPTKVSPIEGEFTEYDTDLVITSVGFKGEPLQGLEESEIAFDSRSGVINNTNSKVLNKNGEIVPGLYTTGWVAHRFKGPILNTFVDATNLATTILSENKKVDKEVPGVKGLNLIGSTNWKDWEALNEFEIKFGELNGKKRWKVPTVELMLEIIKDTDPIETKLTKYEPILKSNG